MHCIATMHVSKGSSHSTLHIFSAETLGFTSTFEPDKRPITNLYHKPWFLFGLAVRGLGTSAKRFGAEDSGFQGSASCKALCVFPPVCAGHRSHLVIPTLSLSRKHRWILCEKTKVQFQCSPHSSSTQEIPCPAISHKALATNETREAFMFHPMFHALFEAT